MANHKSDEPRTYIRAPVSWARYHTDEAQKMNISVPEYLKIVLPVPVVEGDKV